MSLLRIVTAGSVDDGKSTLIGRLLLDTQSVFEDQVLAIERASQKRGMDFTDLSMLTDGLIDEREQGITIDVAYRYFATAQRKFIVADCPGHKQYTRNMVTGASNCELAILLVDATKGLQEQTRRHAAICGWLGLKTVILAVNKMDLVGFDSTIFEALHSEFSAWCEPLGIQQVHAIPLSALDGDMVVHRGERINWYTGPTLLEVLENTPTQQDPLHKSLANQNEEAPISTNPVASLNVQSVVRSGPREAVAIRAFTGRVNHASLSVGQSIVVLPSGEQAKIQAIFIGDRSVSCVQAGCSVAVQLNRDVDVSRGNVIFAAQEVPPELSKPVHRVKAQVTWFDTQPLLQGRRLALKIGTQDTGAVVEQILSRLQLSNLQHVPVEPSVQSAQAQIAIDEIGELHLHTTEPLVNTHSQFANKRFILIDEMSARTVGAGLLVE
jgi:sulfate adenylyltransferase subunit 1